MKTAYFFDNASTSQCCPEAVELMRRFASEDYGNPSSTHVYGVTASRAINEARAYFAAEFGVAPKQVIFTGSGSEADNLAIYGVALDVVAQRVKSGALPTAARPRILTSTTEHPAVKKTVQSLETLGFDIQLIPVDGEGQIQRPVFERLLTPETVLVSIHQVNNITGAIHPVEALASFTQSKVPGAVFHTDSVQAFGKVEHPHAPCSIDLCSISGHKVEGPKGVGALIVLNPKLLASGFRPLIWGGEQEAGFRSGTQNAGLIAGFHVATERVLKAREQRNRKSLDLQARFREGLSQAGLLGKIHWNSPKESVPQIVCISVPGYPSPILAQLLEKRGCLVSTGSACSSGKVDPNCVLALMGQPPGVCSSMIRISFSSCNRPEEVDHLVRSFDESVAELGKLLGG